MNGIEAQWRKSSFSGGNSDCVEVSWRKASFSGQNSNCVEIAWGKSSRSDGNSNCVEVATVAGRVKLRDSKNSLGPTIAIPAEHWKILLTTL